MSIVEVDTFGKGYPSFKIRAKSPNKLLKLGEEEVVTIPAVEGREPAEQDIRK